MFVAPLECLMDAHQLRRWEEIKVALRNLEAESDPADPWLFHGTCQLRAISIIDNGFDPNRSYTCLPDDENGRPRGKMIHGIYWTSHYETAENFALRNCSVQNGFPIIFAAKASDLAKSGDLIPDFNSWEIDTDFAQEFKPNGWQDSLQKLGAVVVAGCKFVPNLKFYCPDDIEVMPDPAVYDQNVKRFFENLMNPEDNPASRLVQNIP